MFIDKLRETCNTTYPEPHMERHSMVIGEVQMDDRAVQQPTHEWYTRVSDMRHTMDTSRWLMDSQQRITSRKYVRCI